MATQVVTVPVTYPSADGVSQVNAKIWASASADRQPKAVFQIVHGMAEYIDRYDDFAAYLVSQGFVVCAEDHIGHGHTAKTPDDLGHMPIKGGKDILIADVHALRQQLQETYPDLPYILYGHSMGSFISRAYIARHADGLSGVILSGTGNVPPATSNAGRTLARIIGAVRGQTYRSKLLDSMSVGAYGKQIENARTPLDWLSTDEAVVDAYIADPLCGFMFSAGADVALLSLTAEIATPAWASRVPKDLPVLFVAGDKDPVGDNGAGVNAAARLLIDAGVKDVSVKLYPGMRHEIHNEVGHEQVYSDIAMWAAGKVERNGDAG